MGETVEEEEREKLSCSWQKVPEGSVAEADMSDAAYPRAHQGSCQSPCAAKLRVRIHLWEEIFWMRGDLEDLNECQGPTLESLKVRRKQRILCVLKQ